MAWGGVGGCWTPGARVYRQDGESVTPERCVRPAPASWVVLCWPLVSSRFSPRVHRPL